jgi:hypothetical protein
MNFVFTYVHENVQHHSVWYKHHLYSDRSLGTSHNTDTITQGLHVILDMDGICEPIEAKMT